MINTDKKFLVSIITTCLDSEKTIQLVLNQTHQNIEYVIGDSKDVYSDFE